MLEKVEAEVIEMLLGQELHPQDIAVEPDSSVVRRDTNASGVHQSCRRVSLPKALRGVLDPNHRLRESVLRPLPKLFLRRAVQYLHP
eukprot:6924293-Prorocentrum_lima.AAC.1